MEDLKEYLYDQVAEINEVIDGLLLMLDETYEQEKRTTLYNKLHDFLTTRNVYLEILDKVKGEE